MKRRGLFFGLGFAAVGAAVLAGHGGLRKLVIETITGPQGDPEAGANRQSDAESLARKLADVGLDATGTLGDLGVDDHLARLAAGEVTADTLLRYAEHIETLTALTRDRGQALPPRFWDVETGAMRNVGWTVYTLTHAMAQKNAEPHLDLLTDAWASYLRIGETSALDAALDILLLSRDYIAGLPDAARVEHAALADTDEKMALLTWQALLSGTSRANPITRRPLWSHGFIGHFSIPKIAQYAVGHGMTLGEVWGTSGFAPRYVGPASNDNQVEHLGISTLLQALVGVKPAELAGIEGFEVLFAGEDKEAATADNALNHAIAEVFLPLYETDFDAAVSALRETLHGTGTQ